MLRSVKTFLRDRKGAFAIQFALMVVPLTVCTGLAVDGGRAFLARYELASALDAAALAVGSTFADDADLDSIAQRFVEANFRAPHNGPIALTLTPGDDVVTLHGTVTLDTYFMPLVGQPTVTVSAESEVRRGGGNVEVALALDITGSMAGSKITALRQAAKDLIEEVVNDTQTPFFSRVAIAPWGTNIHVGSLANALRGPAIGPATITGAHWRDGSNKTISGGAWVNGTAKTISTANWRNGSAFTISAITKTSGRIRVQTSSNHGYANGQFVRITGANGSYTGLNNNIYAVEVNTTTRFYLRNIANTAYITPPSGSSNASAGSSQRCFSGTCEVGVTTSAAHGFSNGDFIRIAGVGTMTAINNTGTGTWAIAGASGSVFVLPGTVGPGSASYNGNGTGGTASECFTATCEFQVTATAHGFANGDRIYINGVTTAGAGTSWNSATGSTWAISGVAANTFRLPGNGMSYANWSASGTAAECYNSTCEVKVTAASHGLSANDYVQIQSVGGITGVNNSGTAAWQVSSATTGNFYLSGWGPGVTNGNTAYTASTGQAQCLGQGCLKYRFTSAAGTTEINTISNCATERVGAQAHTDAAPSVAPLGRDYPGSDDLVGCETDNYITPLTSNKTKLDDTIDDMEVYGSTAGQIGAAWAWYMLSPNWTGVFTGADHQPSAYGTNDLSKVAVLMTDGEFNTAHCNGVTSENYAYPTVSNSSRIEASVCNPADTPFDQAQATCTAMKAAGIIVYTVGFDVQGATGAPAFLNACATSANHAYLADDAAELRAAFKSIAKSISKLRIAR